jgi:glycosyltransferase involved in cell wall biosynthesis
LYASLDRLHAALARKGASVHPVTRRARADGTPRFAFHRLGRCCRSARLGEFIATGWRAARVDAEIRADAFLAFGSVYALFWTPFRRGRPLVTFLRGNWVEQERLNGAGNLKLRCLAGLERWALRRSTAVLAVSRAVVPPGIEATIIPNATPDIRVESRGSARDSLGLPSGGFVVGCLGSVQPVKRLETVVDAVAETRDAILALAGLGETSEAGDPRAAAYAREIRSRAASLESQGRVRFLPWTSPERFLGAIDCLVLASEREGSPNALLEGLGAGLPCFGARSPGIDEMLVHDELLFPFGDAAALARRIEALAGSPEVRARVLKLCAERAEAYRFDWDERASRAVLDAIERATTRS